MKFNSEAYSVAKLFFVAVSFVGITCSAFAQVQDLVTTEVSEEFALGSLLTVASLNSVNIDTVDGQAAIQSRVIIHPKSSSGSLNAYALLISVIDAKGIRTKVLNIAVVEFGEVIVIEKGVRIHAAHYQQTESTHQVNAIVIDVQLLDDAGTILDDLKAKATLGPVLLIQPKE